MINDSVREELKDKISPIIKSPGIERKPFVQARIEPPIYNKPIQQAVIPKPSKPIFETTFEKTVTADITVKPTTPTLVEFQNKNSVLPEWRQQLHNAVLNRQNRHNTQAANTDFASAAPAKLVTSGANALKPEPQLEPESILHKNPTVNSALQRIEQSRRQFLAQAEPQQPQIQAETVFAEPAPIKTYPFRLATKSGEVLPAPVEPKPAMINQSFKPKSSVSQKSEKLDTNKLPILPVKVASNFDIHSTTPEESFDELTKTEIKLERTEEVFEETETEEIEDLAPFAMRFNAGLFDLIIGAFVSFILVTPFMVSNGTWFTVSGFLTFTAVCSIVMFIYMTTAVGFYGRTFGMRIFSLEVVDIEGENYPSIHQAAVSSCLYLLSMAFGGIGFLTLPFNQEKRAVHDLISGTIVVKEI
jgi:uncharacterized RDD family membrane protein YckC